jgi:hypothetical protein
MLVLLLLVLLLLLPLLLPLPPPPLLLLLLLSNLWNKWLYHMEKLCEKKAWGRVRLAYLSMIAIWDIIYLLFLTICARIILGDNLTKELVIKVLKECWTVNYHDFTTEHRLGLAKWEYVVWPPDTLELVWWIPDIVELGCYRIKHWRVFT